MNQKTFRLIVVLAIVSICGFLAIQVFWLGKAFDLKNKQFEHNVNMSLINVSNTLCEINQLEVLHDPIEQLSSNYFIVNLNNRISPDVLESVLKSEFDNRNIAEAFEYGIFDCSNEEMVYGRRVLPEQDLREAMNKEAFPKLEKDAYYFGVYFPHKTSNLVGEMWIWGFSTLVLIIVIAFFSYTLYVIMKQRQLSEIQNDFINNMTHEFKTPIASIGLSSDVLLSENVHENPDRLQRYAGIIRTEVNKLRLQIERMLELATITDSGIQLQLEVCDVLEIIRTEMDTSLLRIDRKGGSMKLISDKPKVVASVDRVHFANVISNLIDNAIKYNDRKPSIEISVKNEKERYSIDISDNGKGIPNQYSSLIFKKFFRVPTGNVHDVKGFGLGLFYVKSIVESHRGRIMVDSTLEGTIFKLSFPQ